jgi:UDP-N-acetylmuramate: L-alanyl-gamma-D-glutamyl-meso-diaminopimelate ligase
VIPDIGKSGIHLLGIGGTAMASLAGLLKQMGHRVTGSDQNVYPPMSDLLAELDVGVRSPYLADNVPEACELVVVGNAISRGNPELEAVLERRIPYVSMPELLKELVLRHRTPVVVAGTHGKTTTTTLLIWLLESAGKAPGFLVGGIPLNGGVSFKIGTGDAFIVEGDEYDTAYFDKGPKFLHYLPQVGIIGNVEFDHADIYRDVADVERAFRLFANLVPRNGLLIVGVESAIARAIAADAPCPVASFACTGEADWTCEVLDSDASGTHFRIRHHAQIVTETRGPFWGDAALRNVLAAAAAADSFGVSGDALGTALSTFRGVRRRLEVRGEERGVVVVDDFAHHPTAIGETLRGARLRFANHRIWGVFEPRSFTARSSVFPREPALALGHADRVVVSSVLHSARLAEADELSEEQLVDDLTAAGTPAAFVSEPDAIVQLIATEARPGDVVLVMSNGGFGGLHDKLLSTLKG